MSPAALTLRFASLLLLAHGLAPGASAQQGTWALTNVRIVTVTRGTIERGTVVIRDGLIAAVGADLSPPADARLLDLAGKTVYPGLIDLTSSIGVPSAPAPTTPGVGPSGAAPPTAAAEGAFAGLEPQRVVAAELRPSLSDVRAVREAGITAVLSAPSRGAFRGQSALLPLVDSVTGRRVLRSPVALHVGFDAVRGGASYPATLLGVMAYERQAFLDALRQAQLLERYRASPRGMARPDHDERLTALIPVVRGELPVFFAANSEPDLRRALGLAREFSLTATVVGATEGFRLAGALAAARRPVVVSVDFPKAPEVTGWAYRAGVRRAPDDSAAADSAARALIEANAATLHRAGVRVALASGGSLRPSEFLANVRKAVAAGLPREVALEALTIRPAEIAGASEQLGSIEAGKIANLVVSEGELLGDSAKVRAVFVDGIRYEVEEVARAAPPAPPSSRGDARTSERAAQVEGTWDVVVRTPSGENIESTLTLAQDRTAITGRMASPMGELPIEEGSVSGQSVTWSISFPLGGRSTTIVFRGEVDGNRMRGSADMPGMGAVTFTAERRP